MARLDLDLPVKVRDKLALYQALYAQDAMDACEVVAALAAVHHVTTDSLDAKTVIWLVEHSKLRQFYG